ncbi:MAG TPA: bifunctional lysine ketoglutarate reductase /saccharopine dehydrogenase family protein [bacterium]|nr:bifunctional lysine ketoglutarate reductase /saccharopine dehydrogenase family protein [bacterium]
MKNAVIGIRREDKNIWEKRVPLVPGDVGKLVKEFGLPVVVQPSMNHRAFEDEAYRVQGAEIREDLSDCDIILGVKEIPPDAFQDNTTYVFFSHVIKGQKYNMPMLKQLLKRKCTLIDYEKIEDSSGRRLIFFGRYAGLAGMVETLHAYGQRLQAEGVVSPFAEIKQPRDYPSLTAIKDAVRRVGEAIARDGLPKEIQPVVCGFTGYGNVSRGAQEIYDLLPVREISPEDLERGGDTSHNPMREVYKVVFHEKHMFEPRDATVTFDLQHYFRNPGKYRSRFDRFTNELTLLVNCIFWTEECPRLVTRDAVHRMYTGPVPPRLKVIGDISCDIEGSMEVTVRATDIEHPTFVYEAASGKPITGVSGNGPVIMAIENLPCEIPVEASEDFSRVLVEFLPELAGCDMSARWETLDLMYELKHAVIAYHGELTPQYAYIAGFLK